MKLLRYNKESAPFVMSPPLQQYHVFKVVGACHGLVCLYCYNKYNYRKMLVIWNPCMGKSFGIVLPSFNSKNPLVFGCMVCPTIVKIINAATMPWHVEVFTLSSGVWDVIPSGYLPRQSIRLDTSTQRWMAMCLGVETQHCLFLLSLVIVCFERSVWKSVLSCYLVWEMSM
nr:hypothetical protein [Tanacetum cinerariifolium]